MKRLVFLRHLLFITILSYSVLSCTKDISSIGLDLVEPVDLLTMGYTDTVKIVAYTIPDDSVYTHNLSVNNGYYIQVGSMYDPIFGKTTSDLYSQLYLSQSRTRFGTDPVFDSAFLYLPYYSAYGDTLTNMTFRVYNLTEDIVDSLHSFSYNKLSYDPVPIGQITFQPRPSDSSYYQGKKHAPMLRIPINKKFGNTILGITDTSVLNSNANFVKVFKGICIIAEPQNTPGKGSICTFRMPADYFKLQMHYHNPGDTALTYNFAISYSTSRFQNYDHNGYAEAVPLLRQQLEGDTNLGQQYLFAQGLAGTKIKIRFPYLAQWFDSEKIVINDAQLILGNSSVSTVFPRPSSLLLRGIGENGSTSPVSIVDENEGSGYFDGRYDAATNSYRFRITRYVQQMLTGKVRDNGFHLLVPSSAINGARLVLNGTSSPQSDLKLYLRYTKLK